MLLAVSTPSLDSSPGRSTWPCSRWACRRFSTRPTGITADIGEGIGVVHPGREAAKASLAVGRLALSRQIWEGDHRTSASPWPMGVMIQVRLPQMCKSARLDGRRTSSASTRGTRLVASSSPSPRVLRCHLGDSGGVDFSLEFFSCPPSVASACQGTAAAATKNSSGGCLEGIPREPLKRPCPNIERQQQQVR